MRPLRLPAHTLEATVLVVSLLAAGAPPLAAPARAAEVIIKVALSSSGDHIFNRMARVMGQEIEKRVPGKVDWQVFADSQLGGDSTIMKGLVLGTHMLTMNGSWFQSIQPEFSVFDTPFFFKDQAQAQKVAAAIQPKLAADLLPKGVVLLGIGDLGFREVSNNVRPIVTPADLKGIKLRVPGNPASLELFRTLGANPTPMDIAELYMGLRGGVLDGQENPLQSIYAYKFQEVQKYISMTNHVFSGIFIGASTKYWNTWPSDVQQAIRAASEIAAKFSFEQDIALQDDVKKKILASNPDLKFNDVDFPAFQQAVKPLYDKIQQTVGTDIWNMTTAALK